MACESASFDRPSVGSIDGGTLATCGVLPVSLCCWASFLTVSFFRGVPVVIIVLLCGLLRPTCSLACRFWCLLGIYFSLIPSSTRLQTVYSFTIWRHVSPNWFV